MITKIIHQLGPTNKNDWHPLWFKCQESWLKNFPDFEYKLWNDEDIDNFIRNEFPEYWDTYNQFPIHILKIDFARYCILYKYGGIYADLDVFCYKNFFDFLTNLDNNGAFVVENIFGNDPFENSLMCSATNHSFFKQCADLSISRYHVFKQLYPDKLFGIGPLSKTRDDVRPMFVFFITGTQMVSTVARQNLDKRFYGLPSELFNFVDGSYDKNYYTNHIHTGVWGSENIEILKKNPKNILNHIPVHQYDFFKDYTQGDYKKHLGKTLDYDKNNSDTFFKSNTRIEYS